ncbi:hypothetical protein F3Y22_tig00110223pilonHSYRG00011 [Hibiscus syriacus]|uniref:Uncharacterized protein n=1 Tax=Hibiscus syriacus TaxID=106335 RepID=A0A6A3BDC4_HIBSY|nr:hypothetical protein F3Y22_tig00110223pilonHSYRG00011 [Hibiscus syriacus]
MCLFQQFAFPHQSVDLVHLLEMSLSICVRTIGIHAWRRRRNLLVTADDEAETVENRIFQSLLDLEWMCNILPKTDLMKDFVCRWGEMSGKVWGIIEDKKLDNAMWGLKLKLIEVTGKVCRNRFSSGHEIFIRREN